MLGITILFILEFIMDSLQEEPFLKYKSKKVN